MSAWGLSGFNYDDGTRGPTESQRPSRTSDHSLAYLHIMQIEQPEDVPAAFQVAWNNHDMPSFAALFRDDATFVNRFGRYVFGIADIVELHAPLHAGIYSDSTLKNELIDVVTIGDTAAVVHFWSRLTVGVAHPAGPHAVDTLILTVLTRQESTWRIKALENVTLTNPRTGEAVLRDMTSS